MATSSEEESMSESGSVSESDSEYSWKESDKSESEQESSEGSMSFTLTDRKVLDCSICFQPLTIPVYQCDNGHITCSTCNEKISDKCPTCGNRRGYSRCRAIEKVLESVKVSCRNTKYGCREALSRNAKKKHEKSCPFVPCSCPIPDCNFEGSSEQLRRHFGNEHKRSAIRFHYDRTVFITLRVGEKSHILREETDGSLFILNNKVETMGNVVTVSRIGASTERSFLFKLVVEDGSDTRNTLKLKSYIKSSPKRVDSQASSGFLLVPNKFSCTSRKINLKFIGYRPA